MIAAILGTLSAIAAIADVENFVPSTLLFLTPGEWEILAVVGYVVAIVLYVGSSRPAPRSSAPRRGRWEDD